MNIIYKNELFKAVGGARYENFVPRLFSRTLARHAFICL